jgi:hypothetical protein
VGDAGLNEKFLKMTLAVNVLKLVFTATHVEKNEKDIRINSFQETF